MALKVQSRAIAHKAAAGGVALALADADAVRDAYERVVVAAGSHLDGTHFDGVLVQSMATAGLELLVGVQNRSGLGPIVVVGFGGALVEIIDRTAMFPAPFGEAVAAEMLREIGVDRALGPEFAEFAGMSPTTSTGLSPRSTGSWPASRSSPGRRATPWPSST